MQFKRLFWIRLITVSLPGAVSIPMALYGFGYWALVAGTLVGQAAQVVVLWSMSTWRPSWSFDPAVATRLARFGGWVAFSGLLAWFFIWADSFIIGMHLGAHDLGLYRTANVFIIMIFGVLFAPLLPVLYSHLSSIQHDKESVKRVLMNVVRWMTFISIPLAFGIFALAEPASTIVFGSNWSGISQVVAILALMHGLSWTIGANGEAYRAIGRPDFETKIMAFSLPFYLLVYWVTVQQGLLVFLWARLLLSAAAIGVHLWVAHLAFAFPVTRTLIYLGKVSAVGVPLVLLARNIDVFGSGPWRQLSLAGAAGAIWALSYLWFIERNALVPEAIEMIRRRISGRS